MSFSRDLCLRAIECTLALDQFREVLFFLFQVVKTSTVEPMQHQRHIRFRGGKLTTHPGGQGREIAHYRGQTPLDILLTLAVAHNWPQSLILLEKSTLDDLPGRMYRPTRPVGIRRWRHIAQPAIRPAISTTRTTRAVFPQRLHIL